MQVVIFYYTLLLLVCAYAIRRGGKPEYYGAAVIAVGSILTSIVGMTQGASWVGPEEGILIVDLIFLLALIHLTIVTDRFWPMWFTAFHLVSISIHAAVYVAPDIAPWAYAAGQGSWGYLMLLALAIGTHEHVRPNDTEAIRSG